MLGCLSRDLFLLVLHRLDLDDIARLCRVSWHFFRLLYTQEDVWIEYIYYRWLWHFRSKAADLPRTVVLAAREYYAFDLHQRRDTNALVRLQSVPFCFARYLVKVIIALSVPGGQQDGSSNQRILLSPDCPPLVQRLMHRLLVALLFHEPYLGIASTEDPWLRLRKSDRCVLLLTSYQHASQSESYYHRFLVVFDKYTGVETCVVHVPRDDLGFKNVYLPPVKLNYFLLLKHTALQCLLDLVMPLAVEFKKRLGCTGGELPKRLDPRNLIQNHLFSVPVYHCSVSQSLLVAARLSFAKKDAYLTSAISVMRALPLALFAAPSPRNWTQLYFEDEDIVHDIVNFSDAILSSPSVIAQRSATPQVAIYRALRRMVRNVIDTRCSSEYFLIRGDWPFEVGSWCDGSQYLVRAAFINKLLHVRAHGKRRQRKKNKEKTKRKKANDHRGNGHKKERSNCLLTELELEAHLLPAVSTLLLEMLLSFVRGETSNARRAMAVEEINVIFRRFGLAETDAKDEQLCCSLYGDT